MWNGYGYGYGDVEKRWSYTTTPTPQTEAHTQPPSTLPAQKDGTCATRRNPSPPQTNPSTQRSTLTRGMAHAPHGGSQSSRTCSRAFRLDETRRYDTMHVLGRLRRAHALSDEDGTCATATAPIHHPSSALHCASPFTPTSPHLSSFFLPLTQHLTSLHFHRPLSSLFPDSDSDSDSDGLTKNHILESIQVDVSLT